MIKSSPIATILTPTGTVQAEYLNSSASSSCCAEDDMQTHFEEEDDELHLIGAEYGQSNNIFSDAKTIRFLILNLIINLLAITWLMYRNFTIDLFATILIALAGWTWGFSAILIGKWIIRVREETILAGKADDYRNYVRRVTNSSTTTSTTPPSDIIKPDSYYFSHTTANKPEFV